MDMLGPKGPLFDGGLSPEGVRREAFERADHHLRRAEEAVSNAWRAQDAIASWAEAGARAALARTYAAIALMPLQ